MAILSAPSPAKSAKVYEVPGGEKSFGVVSADAMGYIEAAQRLCGKDEPLKVLEAAAVAAAGNDEVLMGLYAYGRFDCGFSPQILVGIVRSKAVDKKYFRDEARKICVNAVKYERNLQVQQDLGR